MVDPVQVLVVEDEDDIRNLVVMNLKRAGFGVLDAADGAAGLALAKAHRPPVVLLDLMLPDMSGRDICARLRADPETANAHVIMVTAMGEEGDRVQGFEVGADDYVTTPFSVRELVLRVKAAARRVTTPPAPTGDEISRGMVRVDKGAHRAWVEDTELELTATEYKLLVYLAEHEGKLCERGELLQEGWELPPSLNTRTVDTHIKRLRQKLGDAAGYVETVRGAGYRFRVAG
ncbi:MAG: response regulator transcription factor [Myxococcota bacterium]|nr:response regulator transcription factor [Myxococcota bacterium]